ncbi:DUF4214 domain-containing protein [Undibacterium sp. TJN25]|uniref:DUF4214 domain-containing protein n=1 Tax=Undibacterium sp. TJN25 TaxID=3413056 RepID=UPI003BF2CE60
MTTANTVQSLYIAYFNRPADQIGLAYWVDQIDNKGQSITSVANNFALQTEYASNFTGLNTTQVVNQIYLNLFNHGPDLAGLQYWVSQVQSGAMTMGKLAIAILAGATGPDATAVVSKEAAAAAFTADMTTGAQVVAYNGAAAFATAKAWLSPVVDATTATAATTSAPATINAIVAANVAVGTTTVLTADIDTISVVGNNNVITGTTHGAAGVTTTFNPGDTINGTVGATGNTLKLVDLSTGGTWTAGGVAGITVSNIQNLVLVSGEPTAVNTAASIQGFSGLTSLTVTDVGGTSVTAANTTAVVVTDVAAAGATEAIQGGSDVTLVANNVTAGGTINVGTTTAPTGVVKVTVNEAVTTTNNTADAINVTGGSSVTINANLAGAVNNTISGGNVTVVGTAATTSVTVNQTAAATAGAKVAGVVDGNVIISDVNAASATKAGTITSVSVANYGTLTVNDNALTTLNLSGTGGVTTVSNNLTTPTVTTLALNANNLTATSFVDTHNEITTLNVVTSGTTASSIGVITDTGLKTLNVAGTQQLILGTTPASLTSVAVSGAAGVNIALGANTSFTSTGTGTDVVEISAATTKTVTGNGSANEEIIWNGAVAPTATAYLGTVTGFKVLGIGSGVAATTSVAFDMTKLTGFTGFDVLANSTTNTVQLLNVAAGSPLTIDGAFAGTLVYSTADSAGLTDKLALTLGAASNTAGFTVNQLTLQDNAHFGIGTLSVTTNATGANTITAFQDAGLSTLNVAGTGGLTFAGNVALTGASLTVNATSGTAAGGVGTVTFGGGITDTSLTSLTLSGTDNISFGTITHGTNGIVVAGASDNANISLALAGVTGATHADSVTLGNGNNVVTDTAAAGAVNITLGNGNNVVTVGATATNTVVLGTGHNSVIEAAGGNVAVTFGAHSATTIVDNVTVGASTTATVAPTAVITGFNDVGVDTITFSGDAGATGSIVAYTVAQINTFGANPTTLASAIAGVLAAGGGNLAQHSIGEFTFQGNTYFVEQAGATGSAYAAGDTIVELVGNHTFTSATSAAAGVLTLHG